jgi:hypothetical protein
VQFFLEATSFKNWFVAPTDNPWSHNNPTSVGGRTIINARKEYIVESSIIEEFSKSKGNVQINPISIINYSNNLELDFSFSNVHQIKFNVLDGLPYPSVIFSATLVNSASDFNQLLQEIMNRINSNSIFRGELSISFKAIKLLNKSLLAYNLRNILIKIAQTLKVQEYTKWNLYKQINDFITSNFSSLVNTEFSQLSGSEKDKLIDNLCSYFTNMFIAVKTNEQYFDGEISFEKIVLRDPLEVQDKNIEKILLNTSLVTETFHLK